MHVCTICVDTQRKSQSDGLVHEKRNRTANPSCVSRTVCTYIHATGGSMQVGTYVRVVVVERRVIHHAWLLRQRAAEPPRVYLAAGSEERHEL